MKNLRNLPSELTKREGKKSQVSIGNVRELIKILTKLDAEVILEEGDKAYLWADAFALSAFKLAKKLSKKKK